MLDFFIRWSDKEKFDPKSSYNTLGSVSFNQFWVDDGFSLLKNKIEFNDPNLSKVKIIDSNKKEYTIEQFLDELKKYKIKDA